MSLGKLPSCEVWLPQVLVSDPAELEKIRQRESDITKERIEKILASGANVILTTKGIDDMSLKYLVEAGAIAARRVPKDDLRCSPVPCEHATPSLCHQAPRPGACTALAARYKFHSLIEYGPGARTFDCVDRPHQDIGIKQ